MTIYDIIYYEQELFIIRKRAVNMLALYIILTIFSIIILLMGIAAINAVRMRKDFPMVRNLIWRVTALTRSSC